MTGGVPSVQRADDAFALDNDPIACEAGVSGLNAATTEEQFSQTHLKTHEMQAVLARAVETGQFDGPDLSRSAIDEAVLLRVLAKLEGAKAALDRVRLRA